MIALLLTEEYRKSRRLQPNLLIFQRRFWFFYSAALLIIITTVLIFRIPYKKTLDILDVDGDILLESQKIMLDDPQLIRLEAINVGRFSKHDIEIVISRFNEDIRWSDMYSTIRTVYDKSKNSTLPSSTAGKVVSISNLGRESYTYLWHIVNNYDKLAAVTVFSQGSAPFHGYSGHRKGGGHLLENSTFHDFVLSATGHFIFTGAVWLPTLAHLLRSGWE